MRAWAPGPFLAPLARSVLSALRAVAALLAVTVMVAVGGCGVPIESSSRPISDGVPFGLLSPAPSSPPATVTAPTPAETVTVDVFLVRGDRLIGVQRQVLAPVSVPTTLAALLEGPDDGEISAGVRTAISVSTRLLSTEVEGETVRLNLAGSFGQAQGGEQRLAVAQLVFTATSVAGVRGVSFALDGRPVEIPTGDGTLRGGPVGPEDFPALAPIKR